MSQGTDKSNAGAAEEGKNAGIEVVDQDDIIVEAEQPWRGVVLDRKVVKRAVHLAPRLIRWKKTLLMEQMEALFGERDNREAFDYVDMIKIVDADLRRTYEILEAEHTYCIHFVCELMRVHARRREYYGRNYTTCSNMHKMMLDAQLRLRRYRRKSMRVKEMLDRRSSVICMSTTDGDEMSDSQ